MHATIAAFPMRETYGDDMRNSPGTHGKLDNKYKGLRQRLINNIADHGIEGAAAREAYKKEASDDQARLHWIQVSGTRVRNTQTGSSFVVEHVSAFFDKIYPCLREYFDSEGLKMGEHVMIICSYAAAVSRHTLGEREWMIMDVADRP